MMKNNEHASYFVPEEDELESMTVQLKKKRDKRQTSERYIKLMVSFVWKHIWI